MKILGFVKGDATVASSRHRYWQIVKILEDDLGASVTTYLPEDVEKMTSGQLKQAIDDHDVIWLQRPLYKKESFFRLWFALMTKRKLVLFDYDDAIYRHSKIKFFLLAWRATIIVAGNKTLANALHGLKRAYIIPTTIPGELSVIPHPPTNDGELKIGWAGDAIAHEQNLDLLIEPFKKMMEKNLNFSFLLIGAKNDPRIYERFAFLGARAKIIDQLPWHEVMERLQGIDVGVMPLVDDDWNRGKCALKAIEYMALGKPAIVSPVGMNRDLMEGGLESLLAKNTNDWISAFERFAKDKNELTVYGALSKKRIERLYTNQAAAVAYLTLFKSFL